ncbi:ATP-binding protein [Miltoncostaea oceani]|uniref:ATP-binding protein n=1 Tax=Miltoncostaea oceani TaxID=2843216 RepID=UPI001C3CECF5|nr:AAA family ATPase [Miltoncostaea oceani]
MLRIRLVGELRVELDGRGLPALASRRARSLLAWLAYHPGLHPRTRVASVFWPDVLDASARASLRTTLALLRRDLGDGAGAAIAAGRDRIGIEDGPGVVVDVREIDRLAAAGQGDAALALCTDDLLTDLDDDWVLEARDAHRDRVVALLADLGRRAEEAGDLATAIAHARRRRDLEPVSEDAARVLMDRLAASGDAAAAVAVYEAFRAALRRDLGMTPSARTRALASDLRAGPRSGDAGAVPLPAALARPEATPLVGRREELAALRSAWAHARAGTAGVVVVAGEAGSGKTRLLTEMAQVARRDGATVLAGRCTEDGVVAFAAFAEALRPYAAAAGDTLPGWVTGELARLLPELAAGPAPDGAPEGARHRLFEAVAATVGAAAAARPVLLVVEDLHWADAATLQMLAHVVRSVGWAPLLVLGSTRHEDAAAVPALHALLGDLRRERRLGRVALDGLTEAEVGALTGAWLGAASPPELTAAVHARTGGNPLFVEELARHLAEAHPGAAPAALAVTAGDAVPQGVRSVIDRRLVHLGDPTVRAVRVAAVLGDEFDLADLAAASATGDDALVGLLDAAVAAGLVHETAVPGRYGFAHALVRAAVLAGLTGTRRALLHRTVADALEALPGDAPDRRAGEIARHLLDARPLVEAPRVAAAALRAAGQATRRLAYEDAVALLARTLDGDLGGRDPLRAEVLLALGDAHLRLGDAPVADACFDDAAAVARDLGDPVALARAALGRAGLGVAIGPVRPPVRALLEEALGVVDASSELRPALLGRLAIELYYAPPPARREELSAEALAAGRRAGGRALREALGARHVALWSPDHAEERLAIADEMVAAARAAGDREAELQGVNWRVADLFELGERDALTAAIAEHEGLSDALRLPAYRWYGPMWRAALALLDDRLDAAAALSDQGARIGRAAHDTNAELLFAAQRLAIDACRGDLTPGAHAAIRARIEGSPARLAWVAGLGIAAVAAGDLAAARRELRAGIADLPAATVDVNWLYAVQALGAVAARLGDVAAAEVVHPLLAPHAHRVVTVGRGCFSTGSAALSLGLVAATLGDAAGAVAHLEEAVRRNDAFGAVALAAAARRALAARVDDPARAEGLRRAAAGVGGATLPGDLYR